MFITITLKISKSEKSYDLRLDRKQRIIDFLKIVNESLNLNLNLFDINFVRSKTKDELISVYFTFEDGNIFTGDIIEIF